VLQTVACSSEYKLVLPGLLDLGNPEFDNHCDASFFQPADLHSPHIKPSSNFDNLV